MAWGTFPPLAALALQGGSFIPRGSRVEVFQQIYWVFLGLGTLVGAVVIGYMVYNAYKYRASSGNGREEGGPALGELPTGGGKGGKLFLSFGLSAIIVLSLIGWTYGTLLYVEADSPVEGNQEALTVDVEGYQFGWEYTYPNGHSTGTLRLPANSAVEFRVTSRDVFHNFGIPELRVKTDAIPGQTTESWVITDGPAEYTAKCYELCGVGHSYMQSPVIVMEQDAYEEWYANTTADDETTPTPTEADA